jgi:hypothetical protein
MQLLRPSNIVDGQDEFGARLWLLAIAILDRSETSEEHLDFARERPWKDERS